MKTFTEFNEGVLDFLSKDKREKRKKVKARAQNISNITIKEKSDIELDRSSKDLEENKEELEEVNEKTKNIFSN